MSRNAFSFTLVLVSALALSACGTKTLTLTSFNGTETAQVTVEIADSPEEREKGLMHRTELKQDTGMLFVFSEPQVLSFWMKDTKIPLEIIFFDQAGNFVNVHSMEPCTAMPCPSYSSAELSLYALEVNAGFKEQHKIGTGWKLDPKQVQKISKPT